MTLLEQRFFKLWLMQLNVIKKSEQKIQPPAILMVAII